MKTPLENQDHKIDIIEHINDDHVAELIAIVSNDSEKIVSAKIIEIYKEGCIISYTKEDKIQEQSFIPFTIKGEAEEQIFYLAYKAMIDNNTPIFQSKKQYFEVLENNFVTKNMLRLKIKSDLAIKNKAGYSLLFCLKVLEKTGKSTTKTSDKLSFTGKVINKFFLFVMKLMSSKKRTELLKSMNKKNRYYTVRKSWKEEGSFYAFIDIYIHGPTNGGNWAKSLKKGDIIHSLNDYDEKTKHLSNGNALLIADETSLPALASVLEQWENITTPKIMVILNDNAEEVYLKKEKISNSVIYLENSEKIYDQIINEISKLEKTTTIWGGLEKKLSSKLRKHLRSELNIEGSNNKIIGYWNKK